MRANGAVVEEFSLGLVDYVIPAYYIIASAEASSNLARFDGVKYGYRAEKFEGLHDMYKRVVHRDLEKKSNEESYLVLSY